MGAHRLTISPPTCSSPDVVSRVDGAADIVKLDVAADRLNVERPGLFDGNITRSGHDADIRLQVVDAHVSRRGLHIDFAAFGLQAECAIWQGCAAIEVEPPATPGRLRAESASRRARQTHRAIAWLGPGTLADFHIGSIGDNFQTDRRADFDLGGQRVFRFRCIGIVVFLSGAIVQIGQIAHGRERIGNVQFSLYSHIPMVRSAQRETAGWRRPHRRLQLQQHRRRTTELTGLQSCVPRCAIDPGACSF